MPRKKNHLRPLAAPDTSPEEFLINAQARPGRAAASTVEALVYQLRRGGTGLSNLMPHIARAWSPFEVELLVQLWSDLHG